MPGATLSDLSTFGALRELYSEDKRYQEHVQSSMYNFLKKADPDEVEFDGANFNIEVKLQLNESYAAINDDERLPDSDVIKSVFAKYGPKKMYSVFEATNFAATRGHKRGRSAKYLDDLMKDTLLAFMSGLDFDCYGNGRGWRAKVTSASAAASSFVVQSSMRLRPGMKLDWYDSTLATKRGSIKIDIKSVDRMNRTVYIDSTFGTGAVPSGATSGDVLVVYNALSAGEPSDGRYIMGFDRVLDNSLSVGTLSPSTYAAWQAVTLNAGSGNISQDLLQTIIDSIYNISGFYPNRMAFHTCQKRAYLNQFLSQRRFTTNNFDTGAATLSFDAVKMGSDEKGKKPSQFEMLEDKNAPVDKWLVWHYDCYQFASDYTDEPSLADEDGSEMRYRLGYDAMQGFYRFWANLVTGQRNGIGAVTSLAVPSSVL